MKIDDLQPGLYIQRGDRIKSVDQTLAALIRGSDSSPEALAEAVAYVWIALNYRKDKTFEIPFEWIVNDMEQEQPPFKFDWVLTAPRIDESLQLRGVAYLLKLRGSRNRLIGVRWLDTRTITPDDSTIDPQTGYTRYIRTNPQTGQQKPIPATDIIRIILPGQSELDPPASAAMASSLAAQILYGIGMTADGVYDNNALPVMLINVPAATPDADKTRLEKFFGRIFNQRRTTGNRKDYRTLALREGVTVTPLSLAPADLAMVDLENAQIRAILAAHKVPLAIVQSDAANYAVAQAVEKQFTSTVGGRLELIARFINADPDIKATGAELVIHTEQHWSMSQDGQAVSTAVIRYATIMQPWAAAYLLGITEDDFPDDIKARGIWLEPVDNGNPETAVQPAQLAAPAALLADEADPLELEMKAAKAEETARFRRWYKKRGAAADIDAFNSTYLTRGDKLAIVEDTAVSAEEDAAMKAYFDTLAAVLASLPVTAVAEEEAII